MFQIIGHQEVANKTLERTREQRAPLSVGRQTAFLFGFEKHTGRFDFGSLKVQQVGFRVSRTGCAGRRSRKSRYTFGMSWLHGAFLIIHRSRPRKA